MAHDKNDFCNVLYVQALHVMDIQKETGWGLTKGPSYVPLTTATPAIKDVRNSHQIGPNCNLSTLVNKFKYLTSKLNVIQMIHKDCNQ